MSGEDRVRLLVVRNDPTCPPALLGQWWQEVGVELVEVLADAGDPVPSRVPEDVDGVVLLGGAQAAWADDSSPWLPAERALVAHAVASSVPVLGVCLGGQVMTLALGGVVERARVPEVGITELQLLPAAAEDPVFSVLAEGVPVTQYHGDEMTVLPAGSVLLASTDACPHQAYRVGDRAWAVEFHPEVDSAVVDAWLGDDPEPVRRLGAQPEAVLAQVRARDGELVASWRPFAHAFADVVRRHAAG